MAMGLTLYELAHEHRRLAELLKDTGQDEQAIADTLEAEAWAFEQKALAVAFAIAESQRFADDIRGAEATLAQRRQAVENRVDWLKRYLADAMAVAGVTAVQDPRMTISLRQGSGKTDIVNAADVPADYWRDTAPKRELDRERIRDALKAGVDVPGARLSRRPYVILR